MKYIKLAVAGVVAVCLSGCIRSLPDPALQVYQAGDTTATCNQLLSRIATAKQAQANATHRVNKQIGTNVVLGVTGAFLIVPLFFMDTGAGPSMDEMTAGNRLSQLQQTYDEKCK